MPPLVLAGAGIALCFWLMPLEQRAVEVQLVGFPDSDVFGHRLRPLLLGALLLLPAMASLVHAIAGPLDRYVVRQFLPVFGLCFACLLLIWFLIDLADNLSDLRQSPDFVATMLRFYGLQMLPIMVMIVPYSLLLSLLYCLGRLSRSREIVAMIQTGRGILRLIAPLLWVGLFASIGLAILNYHWAPWAAGLKRPLLTEARGGFPTQATHVLYFEGSARRLWKVGAFPLDLSRDEPLIDVEVTQLRKDGKPQSRLLAPSARWDRNERHWIFEEAWLLRFKPDQPPVFERAPDPLVRRTWTETPWQLIRPGLRAGSLGIPDLNAWLAANRYVEWADQLPYLTQWHRRWAEPFVCLVTVLLATPLGIVFSRRGASSGVALALILCGGMVFVSTVAVTLGETGYLPPALAAWSTNLLFGGGALYLIHRRMSGLPIYQAIRRLLPLED